MSSLFPSASTPDTTPLALPTLSHVFQSRKASDSLRSRAASDEPSLTKERRVDSAVTDRKYAPTASIVLIGIRGTGKSSLAIIAASALHFRLVDADQFFYQTTGLSRPAFKVKHGAREYRRREVQIMRLILSENESGCVITCGPGSVEGTGKSLLRDYSDRHPIIYIMRDTEEIQRYLRAWDADTIAQLVELSGPTYRTLSSFEFYNISETPSPLATADVGNLNKTNPRSLLLKNAEQDFLTLIDNITSQTVRQGELEARYAHSTLPLELKLFTYALSLPLSALPGVVLKLGDVDSMTDAAEFIVDIPVFVNGRQTFDNSMANSISKLFYLVRRNTRLPIIFHVQHETLVSPTTTSPPEPAELEEVYFNLLHHGLRLAPEYLCVDITCNDLKIQRIVAAKGSKVKIIGHYFDNSPGPDGWTDPDRKAKLQRAETLGCDIVRLCQPANSMNDNISVLRFAHEIRSSNQPHRPLIAYNSGPLGRMSCWFNRILTPIRTPLLGSLDPTLTFNPLLTIREAQNALYSSFALDRMVFGIFGSNVTSSLSPPMHNAAYKSCGMPHEYKIFQRSTLKDLDEIVQDPCFGGASITYPFKKDILSILDFISPEARAIGAVNTLVPLRSKSLESLPERNRAGHVVALYGENTDWIGIYSCIIRNLSPVNAVKMNTTGLVLGAGGMSRAAVYAMIRLGVRTIFIHNRTLENAKMVAKQFNCRPHGHNVEDANSSPETGNQFSTTDTSGSEEPDGRPVVRTIRSLEEAWPADADPPTMVVSCIPGRTIGNEPPNIVLPSDWLASKTGGVFIEVCAEEPKHIFDVLTDCQSWTTTNLELLY
jgi:shikimate 5-dehydrogenase/shikimate kinase